MSLFDYVRKLIAELRAGDIKAALGTFVQLFILCVGFNPLPQLPTPNPSVGTMATASAADCNAAADTLESWLNEHDKPGAQKFGDGVLFGKLLEVLLPLLLKFVGLKNPA